MMLFPKTIRWRLQLWYGVLLVCVLGGFGLTAFHLEKERRLSRIDDGLRARVSALFGVLRAAPERGPEIRAAIQHRIGGEMEEAAGGGGYYFAIWMQESGVVFSSEGAPVNLSKPELGQSSLRVRDGVREAFLFAAPVGCVLVGYGVKADLDELRVLAWVLSSVGAGLLCVGIFGGWWLTKKAIRPVEDIGVVAGRIAAGDLGERIRVSDPDTEIGQLATVLNATFSRLEALFQQQARFVSDAAHELRTPVAVVLSQAQSALNRERSGEDYREALQACERSAQRMRRMIESLLQLARLDAGQEGIALGSCDLSQLTLEAIECIRPLSRGRRLQISESVAPSICLGNEALLSQVLLNLLGNAVAHNCDGGEIQVRVWTAGEEAVVRISNTGSGMAAEDLIHVFERFYRGDKARSCGEGHSGLGLAIVEGLVKAHGGSVAVSKEEGGLVAFEVRLPALSA